MLILAFGSFFMLLGSGLADADTRGIGIVICGVAGALFGVMQRVILSLRLLDIVHWMALNSIAWAMGGLAGGFVGFAVYASNGSPSDLSSSEGSMSLAVGAFVALIVYGIVTGVGAALLLRDSQVAS